jgi:hypothetical protein
MDIFDEKMLEILFKMPGFAKQYAITDLLADYEHLYKKMQILDSIKFKIDNTFDPQNPLTSDDIKKLFEEGEADSRYPEINRNMFYSFDVQDIHFVSISSAFAVEFIPFPNSKKWLDYKYQAMKWLDDDLFIARKIKNSRFIIVYSHVPIHFHCGNNNKSGRCRNETFAMQNFLKNILSYYNVDMYMSGHYHAYMRGKILYNDEHYWNGLDTKFKDEPADVYDQGGGLINLVIGIGGDNDKWPEFDISRIPEESQYKKADVIKYSIEGFARFTIDKERVYVVLETKPKPGDSPLTEQDEKLREGVIEMNPQASAEKKEQFYINLKKLDYSKIGTTYREYQITSKMAEHVYSSLSLAPLEQGYLAYVYDFTGDDDI